MDESNDVKRQKMVQEQLVMRGITDQLVLSSFNSVPRHLFVPSTLQPYAYRDTALPIGEGQTISQPFIVALMAQTARLTPQARVLEIGTGSGYAAAILSRMVAEVYTIERLPSLAQSALSLFQLLGYHNIVTQVGDGTMGWLEKGPFDAIIVAAGAPLAPETLLHQLKLQGRLIIPVGDQFMQELRCYCKTGEKEFEMDHLEWVRFVPLLGEQGWPSR